MSKWWATAPGQRWWRARGQNPWLSGPRSHSLSAAREPPGNDCDEEEEWCNSHLDLLYDHRPGAGDALGRQRVDRLQQLPARGPHKDHIKLWAVRGGHLKKRWWRIKVTPSWKTWGSTAIEVKAMLSPVLIRTGWLKNGGTASFINGWVLMKFKLASLSSLLLFGQDPVMIGNMIGANIWHDHVFMDKQRCKPPERKKTILWLFVQNLDTLLRLATISV